MFPNRQTLIYESHDLLSNPRWLPLLHKIEIDSLSFICHGGDISYGFIVLNSGHRGQELHNICSLFLDVSCPISSFLYQKLNPLLHRYSFQRINMPAVVKHKLLLYADDAALLVHGKNLEDIESSLSSELEIVNEWLIRKKKLSLHLGKTESILFGSKHRLKSQCNLDISCKG